MGSVLKSKIFDLEILETEKKNPDNYRPVYMAISAFLIHGRVHQGFVWSVRQATLIEPLIMLIATQVICRTQSYQRLKTPQLVIPDKIIVVFIHN